MLHQKNSKWTNLEPVPKDYMRADGAAVMINDHEFILLPPSDNNAIIKYNVHENKWRQFIKYPLDIELHHFQVTVDRDNNKLHILTNDGEMTIIDIKSHRFKIIKNTIDQIDEHCFVSTNDRNLHLIGGYTERWPTLENDDMNNKFDHRIWNNDKQCFEGIYKFAEYDGILSAKTIYVPSKQIIVLVGGYNDDDDDEYPPLHKIWIYSLLTESWTPINNISLANLDAGTHELILTSDEKNILITGYWNAMQCRIAVLQIGDGDDEYILRMSNINCPKDCVHYVARTGGVNDEMLVIGYINQLFTTKQFKMLIISNDIIRLIVTWFSMEMLHWISTYDEHRSHFGIAVHDILSSLE